MLACLVSLILSAIFKSINPNYLIVGLFLPLMLAHKGVTINNYWECFALLLLVRRFTNALAFLDVHYSLYRSCSSFACGILISDSASGFQDGSCQQSQPQLPNDDMNDYNTPTHHHVLFIGICTV
jgi:hypothetical protein